MDDQLTPEQQQHLLSLTPRQRKQFRYVRSEKGRIAKAKYEGTEKGIAAKLKSNLNWRMKNAIYQERYNAQRRLERRHRYNDEYHPETKGTRAYNYYAFEERSPSPPPHPNKVKIENLRKFGTMPDPPTQSMETIWDDLKKWEDYSTSETVSHEDSTESTLEYCGFCEIYTCNCGKAE